LGRRSLDAPRVHAQRSESGTVQAAEPIIQRWVATDVTTNPMIQREIMEFFDEHGVKSIDLAILLAKAMERPWVMGKRRPARIVLRNNPQWEELIPHLRQLKIEVITQQELPLWDDAATAYVRRLRATLRGREVPILTVPPNLDEAFPAVSCWVKSLGRIEIGIDPGRGMSPGMLVSGRAARRAHRPPIPRTGQRQRSGTSRKGSVAWRS
jgi:hypothetical protein